LGELALSVLTAAARIKTGDTAGALADFEKAYQLSFCGVFEMPFVELGKNMHLLAAAASKQTDCVIPKEWLQTIDRKASIYAKQTSFIRNLFIEEKKLADTDTVQLSEREQEVLHDLYHGLSREEIATNRYLSINTVKKILQSIYIKLDANNKVDAIRIAIEKKLV
jgi:LuxR family maltose regulon positive regulatory protein